MSEGKNSVLKTSAVRGGAFASVSRIVRLIFQFGSIAILARLLSPADFGLVGTVAGAVAIISLFRELGLSLAIVQREKVEDDDLSCIFKFTIFLGLGLLLLSGLLGFLISWIFERRELVYIAPFFGLAVMMSALEVVPLGLMRRHLQFGRIAIREIISTAVGTVFGLSAAWMGAGYWALVIAPVTMQVANTLFSWLAIKWRPSAVPFQWGLIKPYLKFGGTLTFGELANYLCQNIDVLLIGKIWGLEPLGYYTRARALVANPINQIAAPMGSVLTPVFSRMRDDPDQQRRWIDNIFGAMLVIGGVAGAWLAVCSEDLVSLMLGSGWEDVSLLMFWFAPLLVFKPAGSVLYSFLISSGRLKTLISWTWMGSVITISAIVIASSYGPRAVAMSLSLAVCLRVFLAIYYCSLTGVICFKKLSLFSVLGVFHYLLIIMAYIWMSEMLAMESWYVVTRIMTMASISVVVLLIWICCIKQWRIMAFQASRGVVRVVIKKCFGVTR